MARVIGGEGDGIDLGEIFKDRTLVQRLLFTLFQAVGSRRLCYCVRIVTRDGEGVFEPYPGVQPYQPPTPDPFRLPDRIPLETLIQNKNDGSHYWPPLASTAETISPTSPLLVIDSNPFRGQIRIQNGPEFLGYFKIVSSCHDPLSDMEMLAARHAVTAEVLRIFHGQAKNWAHENLLGEWRQARDSIRSALGRDNIRLAVRLLATLITSHHGAYYREASIDRAAVFLPTQTSTSLTCVHAHGGDGSAFWRQIQHDTVCNNPNVTTLNRNVEASNLSNDSYYLAWMMTPVNISVPDDSVMAAICSQKGSLITLPFTAQIECHTSTLRQQVALLAAWFDGNDPWVRTCRRTRPGTFSNPNDQFFVMPWFTDANKWPCPLWVFDFGWTTLDRWNDAVPRLQLARALLNEFSSDFESIDWGKFNAVGR